MEVEGAKGENEGKKEEDGGSLSALSSPESSNVSAYSMKAVNLSPLQYGGADWTSHIMMCEKQKKGGKAGRERGTREEQKSKKK